MLKGDPGGIRTHDLAVRNDVVPLAFATKWFVRCSAGDNSFGCDRIHGKNVVTIGIRQQAARLGQRTPEGV